MTHVMHLTLAFTPGGRRQAIATLLKRLPTWGVASDLVCLDELGFEPNASDAPAGVVACLDRRSLLDREAVRKLAAICRQQNTEVIHAHDAASQFTAALLRLRLNKVRLLMTFHRSLGFESATRLDRLRNAFACRLSQAIVTGSRERRSHFLQENLVNSRKVVRIPFGIDTDRFRPDAGIRASLRRELDLDAETTVLGAVGHFGEEKGVDVVLRAYAALARRGTCGPTALVLIGDGTDAQRESMHALAAEIPGRVIFAGFRRDIERWFQVFDVFVHGARQEAFGLVLVEAMAVGLSVVATRVGGIPDIVRDGQTGLLASSEDHEAMATAFERLVRDPSQRATMGAEARRLALAEYSADLYAKRYAQLYQDIVAGRAARGVDEEATGLDRTVSEAVETVTDVGLTDRWRMDTRSRTEQILP